MEEDLRARVCALRFHKLVGNVTCGGALQAHFKETAVCVVRSIQLGKKIEHLFCLFFFLFSLTFASPLNH